MSDKSKKNPSSQRVNRQENNEEANNETNGGASKESVSEAKKESSVARVSKKGSSRLRVPKKEPSAVPKIEVVDLSEGTPSGLTGGISGELKWEPSTASSKDRSTSSKRKIYFSRSTSKTELEHERRDSDPKTEKKNHNRKLGMGFIMPSPRNKHPDGESISQDPSDYGREYSLSNISVTSFKRWHKLLQTEHELLRRSSFVEGKCYHKLCGFCRWFDSIPYDKKICKCCLAFRTFKTWATILLIGCFFYVFMYSIFGNLVFPGGTLFFIFVLSLTAYLVGHGLAVLGLSSMIGHFGIGIIFGNLPPVDFLAVEEDLMTKITEAAEKVLVVIALIRAGLLLDLSRLKRNYTIIIMLGLLPFFFEFFVIMICSHFLLSLPWDWSAVQGSLMSVVSLASLITIMTKNKLYGYGEEISLSAILMASAVINVITGVFFYAVGLTFLVGNDAGSISMALLYTIRDFAISLLVGVVAGVIVGFFPDKRNADAAALRIIFIGIVSLSLANVFYEFRMLTEAILSCLLISIIASNIWEELGWHKENNPVLYFYSLAYYVSQPVVFSLLGYTMNFRETDAKEVGLGIAVLFLGLMVREVVSILVLLHKSYSTDYKEKVFIGIAWASKGTFQALLAFSIKHTISDHATMNPHIVNQAGLKRQLRFADFIKQTTVISILIMTPFVCVLLTILSPVLLKKLGSEEIPRKRKLTGIRGTGVSAKL